MQNFRSGTDALLLVAYALQHIKRQVLTREYVQELNFVELGTGEGLVSYLLAKNLASMDNILKVRAIGLDINELSIQVAKKYVINEQDKNFSKLELNFACLDLKNKKSFYNICTETNFANASYVLANPPYYKAGRVSSSLNRAQALHQNHIPLPSQDNLSKDNHVLNVFCARAKEVLVHHGWFFLVYLANDMYDLWKILQEHGFGLRYALPIHTRPQKPARFMLMASQKNAKHDVQFEPSICLYARKKGDSISANALSFCPWL